MLFEQIDLMKEVYVLMKYIINVITIMLISISNVYAHVACSGVPVSSISTVNTPSFHKFNEVGVTGTVVFMSVTSGLCTDSTGDPLASNVFMVIDDYDGGSSLKSLWSSTLLTAKATGQKIDFHAANLGVNTNSFQVLRPYYISIK